MNGSERLRIVAEKYEKTDIFKALLGTKLLEAPLYRHTGYYFTQQRIRTDLIPN
jgi:hypothetical protein